MNKNYLEKTTGSNFISKNNGPHHLRVRPDVEREDSCRQSAQELRTVPHGRQVGHVVVQVPKELHERDRVLPQPGTFLLRLPRLQNNTIELILRHV